MRITQPRNVIGLLPLIFCSMSSCSFLSEHWPQSVILFFFVDLLFPDYQNVSFMRIGFFFLLLTVVT
jgi:hypothetical protein